MARVAMRYRLGTIVVTGITAGLLFAGFDIIASWWLMGSEAALMPLRMIGAMVLGPAALDRSYSIGAAASAGVAVHLMLSIVFTGIFAAVISVIQTATLGELVSTPGSLAFAGVIYGLALWVVNFSIAPFFGWHWFPDRANEVVQMFGHAFFYGGPMGWMLGQRPRA